MRIELEGDKRIQKIFLSMFLNSIIKKSKFSRVFICSALCTAQAVHCRADGFALAEWFEAEQKEFFFDFSTMKKTEQGIDEYKSGEDKKQLREYFFSLILLFCNFLEFFKRRRTELKKSLLKVSLS